LLDHEPHNFNLEKTQGRQLTTIYRTLERLDQQLCVAQVSPEELEDICITITNWVDDANIRAVAEYALQRRRLIREARLDAYSFTIDTIQGQQQANDSLAEPPDARSVTFSSTPEE
jgi:hypothetical protein